MGRKNYAISLRINDAMAQAIRERGELVTWAIRKALMAWAPSRGIALEVPAWKPVRGWAEAQPGSTRVDVPSSWRVPLERVAAEDFVTVGVLARRVTADWLGVEWRAPGHDQLRCGRWEVNYTVPPTVAERIHADGGPRTHGRTAVREWLARHGLDLSDPGDPVQMGPRQAGASRIGKVGLPESWQAPVEAWCKAHRILPGAMVRIALTAYYDPDMLAPKTKPPKPQKVRPKKLAPDALCPECGHPAYERERRLDEWDAVCVHGHHWWQAIAGVESHVHVWSPDDEDDAEDVA